MAMCILCNGRETMDVLKQKIAGGAAERGFGVLRHGPSLAGEAAGLRGMGAERARFNVGRRQDYMQNILSGGRAQTTGAGRSAYAHMRPGQESGLSSLVGPGIGEYMKGQGGQMGERLGQIGTGFRNLFPRGSAIGLPPTAGGRGYGGMSDIMRSRFQ